MSNVRTAVEKKDATPAAPSPREVIRGLLDQNKSAIGMSLPAGMDVDRFSRLLLTAANTNPELFDCDPRSFLAAGVACAQLGLEPNDARGLAYLIPFKDRNRGRVVNLILGYRGLMDLARRSGMVSSINAWPVFEGDRFEYQLGLEPDITHVPAENGDEDPAKLTHVYAVARINGDPQFVVLTRAQIDKTRDQSPGAKASQSPWKSHYVEMAQKTAIRRLCKYLPQTVEVAQAVDSDDRALMIGDLGGIVPDQHDEDVIDVDATTGEITSSETTEGEK